MDEFLIGHEKLEEYRGQDCIFDCKQWDIVSEEVPEDFRKATLKIHLRPWAYKSLCFSPKIKEINFSLGAHSCKPVPNNKKKDILEFNHYSTLSEDYLVRRWQRYAPRISENDRKMGYTNNYFWSERAIRRVFKKRLYLAKLKGEEHGI